MSLTLTTESVSKSLLLTLLLLFIDFKIKCEFSGVVFVGFSLCFVLSLLVAFSVLYTSNKILVSLASSQSF